ncbi:Dynamin family protein [bacterium D16-76]|nr:Dynamin family protein [bacterium D16-76]
MGLKEFREYKLKQTRAQFADFMGETEETVKRWEEGNCNLDALQKIAQKTGADLNTIAGYEKPTPQAVTPANTWEKAEFTKKSLVQYISDETEKFHLEETQRKNYIDGLEQCLAAYLVKPKITIVGRSDTGKSTLINALLGAEKMPTSWTPTTAIAVYIKHMDEKPAFMPENENAWVFANRCGEETLWDVRRLYDEEYCRKWKIAAGDADVLKTYATRQGKEHAFEAGAAVVFVDAPILQNCDIIDVPGFGTDKESDDILTLKTTQSADVILYLSQANGFMREEDFIYLKENISGLPVWENRAKNNLRPLSNLFIVASQAHTVNAGNPYELRTILDNGYETLSNTLAEHYWDGKCSLSGFSETDYKEALRKRFFTYTTDIPTLCKDFIDDLKMLLEALPGIIDERARDAIKTYIKGRKPSLQAEIEKYEGICAERQRYISLLQEIDSHEVERLEDNDRRKAKVLNKIEEIQQDCLTEFSAYCSRKINVEAIKQMLHDQKVKNKKGEIEQFSSRLQSMLRQQVEKLLSENSKEVAEVTKEYIDSFSVSISEAYEAQSLSVDFDAGWAFTSAISSFGIWGGLGAGVAGWAAAILMPASVFAGAAGTAAAVAALLGPVGLVGGLAVSGVLGIVKLFTGGWQKSVAKKIVSAFEENGIQDMYSKSIKTYWAETKKAFESAAESLDKEWETYVDGLRKSVDENDVHALEERLLSLKNLILFFENIPL